MTSPDSHLPVLASPTPESSVLAELVQLPDEMVALSLVDAATAMERLKFSELVLDKSLWTGQPIFVASPPYAHTKRAKIRSEDTVHLEDGSIGSIKVDTIWAVKPDELEAKIAKHNAREVAKYKLVTSDPMGEGALILANEFGGIDTENPDASARHLLLRALFAGQAELETVKDLAKVGLIHPVLGEMMADELIRLMDEMGKLAEVVGLIPEATRMATAPALLEAALELGRIFVNEHTEEITLAAHIVKDPDLSAKILHLIPSGKNLEAHSTRSELNKQLARRAFDFLDL